ncbi:MAG: hypothetical protein N3F03_03935 [Ignavibacteria bacterium]|nr:hypothetical protein [Ignavibacteria bacterium]
MKISIFLLMLFNQYFYFQSSFQKILFESVNSEFKKQVNPEENADEKSFSNSSRNFEFSRNQIPENELAIEESYFLRNRFARIDPSKTKLFLSPTAQTLSSGSGYVSVYEIFFPSFAYGVTDYLMIGVSSSIIPSFEFKDQMKSVSLKFKVLDKDELKVSAGINYFSFLETSFTPFYGVATYYGFPVSVTMGLGSGLTKDKFINAGFVLLGFHYQLSNRISLISENVFITKEVNPSMIFGIRFFGNHFAIDLGIFSRAIWSQYNLDFYPWIGFTYNF